MSGVVGDSRSKPAKVADALRDAIDAGEYPEGKLPTVRELAAQFGYASQTIRDGLAILVSEERIASAGNRGYFVAAPDSKGGPRRKTGPSDEIKEMRLQIQELTERVAALEARADSGGA
ncbi:winged helix-turn-helix domain-containing protein [Streptomyces luteireticuli]|uniref:winged helix-turn-helix domain-containing protein n=1 Tax=Streptomyces luteireticuli TaxID=173858 RepID=UPI0035560455